MHLLFIVGCLAVYSGLAQGFSDNSQGDLMDRMLLRYTMTKQQFCLLEGRSDLVERCEIPVDGQMVPADGGMVSFPRHSVCHLKMLYPKVDTCIVCTGGSWETSSCTAEAAIHEREKRHWFLLFIPVIICVIFCGRGGGGGGGGGGGRADYKPPSFTTCESPPSIVYADRGKRSATVKWPDPKAKDGNGNEITIERVRGSGKSESEFDQGFHVFQYKATDSKGFSDDCFFYFEIKVHTCTLNWIRHGYHNCTNNNPIFGTTCRVLCEDGYREVCESGCGTDGTKVTCEEDGWDKPIPSCKPVQCSNDRFQSDGFQCTDNNNYGSICSLSCDRSQGFSVSNPSITICLKKGKWYTTELRCVDVLDPVFDNCPAQNIVAYAEKGLETATVVWNNITATDNSGVVTVNRTQGQSSGSVFPKGSSVIKYKATDGEGNEEVCSFTVIVQVLTCAPPPYTDNKLRFDCTSQYIYGSACSISCVGALLNGSNSIACEKDNATPPQMYWQTSTSMPPTCKQTDCDELTPPANGALACDTNVGGAFCVMSCNTNWDIPATALSYDMYTCGWTSGKWLPSAKVPDCIDKRRPGKMLLPSEFYYFTGDCSDPETQEQIRQNHVTALNSSALFAPSGCLSTGICSVEDVEVRCGTKARRKREARINSEGDDVMEHNGHRQKRSENAFIVSWDFTVKYECGTMSTSACLGHHESVLNGLADKVTDMLTDGDFNSTTPGVTVNTDSYVYGYVELQCGEGMTPVLSRGSCAVCPTGTMYNRTSEACSDCPLGTYQDADHSFSCKNCSQGTTTLSTGARSSNECKDMCRPGNTSATGIQPCAPCPVGRYQPSYGSTSCLECPLGTTTQATGVSTAIDCQSYDLAIHDQSQMTSSITTPEAVDSFTLFLWVRINSNTSEVIISFTSDAVNLQIDNTLSVTLQGNPPATGGPMEANKWVPIALVFDYTSKVLTLYKEKQVAYSGTHSAATSPVIATSSTLTISCTKPNGVIIRQLSFFKTSKTSSEITALSSTCDYTADTNTVMTLGDMTGGKVTVTMPSSCNAKENRTCETSDPCNGHTCINTAGSYTCSCQDGYTGTDCSTPPDFCDGNQCKNGATCVSGQSNYTCTCPAGFTGSLCEKEIVDGGYTPWTDWSACSVSCGGGAETRSRTCDNPPPDVDGQPCTGPDTDTRNCNSDPCPVCSASQLQHGANNSDSGPDCDGDDSELQCKVVCKPGFYLSRDQVSGYNCSNGRWKPTTQLPSCIKVIAPQNLTMTATVNFRNPGCLSHEESEGLKKSLEEKTQALECETLPNCVTKIDVLDCSEHSDLVSANITFTVELPEGDLDLESFLSSNQMSPGLNAVVEAIETLETTAQQLQNESLAILEVTSDGVTYTPDSEVIVIAENTCPAGYFAEDGLCGACPTGTYYKSDVKHCEFCPRGSYQDLTGQVACKLCPEGRSTTYYGSIDLSQCNESPSGPTTMVNDGLPNFQGDSSKQTIIIVSSVVGVVIVGAAAVVAIILLKRSSVAKARIRPPFSEEPKAAPYVVWSHELPSEKKSSFCVDVASPTSNPVVFA